MGAGKATPHFKMGPETKVRAPFSQADSDKPDPAIIAFSKDAVAD